VCTHAALLRKGRVIAQGSLEELAKAYREAKGYSYELAVAGGAEELLRELKGIDGVTYVGLENDVIKVRASRDIGGELAELAAKYRIKSLVPLAPSWDELYQFYQGGGWE
jgi:ABC-2 type transport system ATP-binding protein